MLKWPLALALFLLAPAQHVTSTIDALGVEFPPQDHSIWSQERRGLTAKLAAQRLADAPDSPATARLLLAAQNFDGMLRVLRTIVDTQPRRVADAFEALGETGSHFLDDDEMSRRGAQTLRRILADARKHLPDLPKEDAARAERAFMRIDPGDYDHREPFARLKSFIEKYRGTEAALLAEAELIASDAVSQQMFDALEVFARAHPSTTIAASALYYKASQWSSINTLGTLEPRDADPIHRFMRVLSIVKELESGRYPRSKWTDETPDLITGFFTPDGATLAPESVDRFLDACREFVRTHFVLDDEYPDQSGIGYVVTSKMADLFEKKGERISGIERVLAELERSVPDPAPVLYLRGLFYMHTGASLALEQQAMLVKARDTLASLSARGVGIYHRKALATLGALEFDLEDYVKAVAAFRKYATAYPQSSWTWVALLRAGQCEEELGNPHAR